MQLGVHVWLVCWVFQLLFISSAIIIYWPELYMEKLIILSHLFLLLLRSVLGCLSTEFNVRIWIDVFGVNYYF